MQIHKTKKSEIILPVTHTMYSLRRVLKCVTCQYSFRVNVRQQTILPTSISFSVSIWTPLCLCGIDYTVTMTPENSEMHT